MSSPASFYLPGTAGDLFAMYYPPAEAQSADLHSGNEPRNVLYVHPFAGEMPASRNVIASVSRGLARLGFGVLTVDLFGCGDSAGDFSDARWEIWREDLMAAVRWFQERGDDQITLWGLRLGALLAMDFASQSQDTFNRIVLWEPVLSGEAMVTRFLRMNLDEAADGKVALRLVNPEERKSLPAGTRLEIAGYDLPSELIRSLDRLLLTPLAKSVQRPIHWVEIGNTRAQSFRPESLDVVEEWKRTGIHLTMQKLAGLPFWMFPYSVDPRRFLNDLPDMFNEVAG